jgi:hypothetical protein
VTAHDLEAKAASWLAAWNRHDLDAVLTHYADYCVHTSPLLARLAGLRCRTFCGRAALRAAFAAVLVRTPDLHFGLRHLLPGANSVVLVYESGDGQLVAEALEFNDRGQIARASGHGGAFRPSSFGEGEPPPAAGAVGGAALWPAPCRAEG